MLPIAVGHNLWSEAEVESAVGRLEREEAVGRLAAERAVSPAQANGILVASGSNGIGEPVRIAELVKRPGVSLVALLQAVGAEFEADDAEWASIELRYGGYLARERVVAEKLQRLEATPLPLDMPWAEMAVLSFEAREKLARVQPSTLAQAGRIPGVSPADLQHLLIEVLRRERVR
jgi:tRNA uridine 5-carboxymethylaminomethyl modification enzyme